MKLFRFLVVVGFLAICASAAFADSTTDPKLLTSGCGQPGQPACDFYFINSPTFTQTIVLTLDTSGDTFNGDWVASFVNVSGATLTSGFTVDFVVPSGLSFQGCGTPPEGVTSLFTCSGGGSPDSPIIAGGTAVFTLTNASICSVSPNPDDFTTTQFGSTYQSDGDADDNFNSCTASFTLALQPVTGTGGDTSMPQQIVGTITTPEPSSALLLLFGLAVGLVAIKSLRTNLA